MALENCLYQIIGLNSKYFLHRHEHPEHFQYHVLHLLYKNSFDLMQLHNVNISASAKTKTIDKVREPIPKLQKETFKKMFIEDKMYSALPNLETWLQTKFQTLVKFMGQK